MSATNLEELALLDARLGSGTPATWYLGVSSSAIAEDGTGETEPSGGGYARVAVTNNATNFPAATTVSGVGTKASGVELAFPTASADWLSGANLTHWFLATASSGGEIRYRAELTTPKPVLSGDTAKFAAGALQVTQD